VKLVTKERIVKALKTNDRIITNKPEHRVVQTLATIGLRSMCGSKKPATDADELELIYQGFSDPEQVFRRLSRWGYSELNSLEAMKKAWIGSWERLLEQKWARDEKIFKIQEECQISGLDESEVDLDGESLKYHEPSMILRLIESDYKLLYAERMAIAQAFVRAREIGNRVLFQYSGEVWFRTNADVEAIALKSRWAKIWADEDEHHLVLGSEKDLDRDFKSVWFCTRSDGREPAL